MKIRAGLVVIDWNLYPRGEAGIHPFQISRYATAMRNGDVFPPIILEKGTNRCIDGVNRWTTHVKVYGIDSDIECEFRTYKDDGEALVDAVRLNAKHGTPLDPTDIARACELAKLHGVPLEAIGAVVGRTIDEISALFFRRLARTGRGENAEPVILKGCVAHMAGKVLTARQAEVNDRLTGSAALKQIRDVCGMVTENMLNVNNERVVEAARELYAALGVWLKGK